MIPLFTIYVQCFSNDHKNTSCIFFSSKSDFFYMLVALNLNYEINNISKFEFTSDGAERKHKL